VNPATASSGRDPPAAPVTTLSVADVQAEGLIAQIDLQVAQERAALLARAAAQADAIRHGARTQARVHLRRAIAEMRATQQQRTQQTKAELETAGRRQATLRARQALTLAWPALSAAIVQRWQDPAARIAWVAALMNQAAARLPPTGWVVRHPAAWSAAETADLQARLPLHGAVAPRLLADERLGAGLVIEVGGARLDGTPPALLADRLRVEAALLAALEPRPAAGASP